MLLAIDIGNTNIHLGLWDEGCWRLSWRARTVAEKMTDEYAVLVRNFLDAGGVKHDQISAVCMSSVVPSLTPAFEDLVAALYEAGGAQRQQPNEPGHRHRDRYAGAGGRRPALQRRRLVAALWRAGCLR